MQELYVVPSRRLRTTLHLGLPSPSPLPMSTNPLLRCRCCSRPSRGARNTSLDPGDTTGRGRTRYGNDCTLRGRLSENLGARWADELHPRFDLRDNGKGSRIRVPCRLQTCEQARAPPRTHTSVEPTTGPDLVHPTLSTPWRAEWLPLLCVGPASACIGRDSAVARKAPFRLAL